MGKKGTRDRQASMWVATADLPKSAGHPFYARLNRVLDDAGFDTFVEAQCAPFYADGIGRPSLAPGRYVRLLLLGYFEGLDSERAIAWRAADSLSIRQFLDFALHEAPPDHSTLSRTRRLIDVETHQAVFTWVLQRLADAHLVEGHTIGIDATTLEANAAMRSIVRRDTGDAYEAWLTRLAEASGIATPTRAELARFDRKRKKKGSNEAWTNPHDPDAKITKMKDGRTHLAHTAEHAVDLETGAIVGVTVQDADAGDTTTMVETLIEAADQLAAVDGASGVAEVVGDKGYHSNETMVGCADLGVRSYVSEPDRGRRKWKGKAAAKKAVYANRRRIRGHRGQRLLRQRGELLERPNAHLYETGRMRRVHLRGHANILKRLLVHVCGANLGLLMRQLTGVGTPRSLQGRAAALLGALINLLGGLCERLKRSWAPEAPDAPDSSWGRPRQVNTNTRSSIYEEPLLPRAARTAPSGRGRKAVASLSNRPLMTTILVGYHIRRRRVARAQAALLVMALAGCATNPVTGNREFVTMSEAQEIAMGREADGEVRREMGLYEDDGLQRYVEEIGLELASRSHRPELPWSFAIVDSPAVNAFALPGGFIFLTRGIMPFLSDEADLAGVLGHEIGHVTARHTVRAYTRASGTQFGLLAAGIFSPTARAVGGLAETGLGVVFLRYGRDAELQADRLGAEYAAISGWDPTGVRDMLSTLSRISGGSDRSGVPGWLSTHPAAADRVERVGPVLTELAARMDITGLRVNRGAYLDRLDGLIYGDNPDQGVVRGRDFLHTELRFALRFPDGWEVVNTEAQVVAQQPGQEVYMLLQLVQDPETRTLEALAVDNMRSGGYRLDAGGETSINGLDAFVGTFTAERGNDGQPRARVAYINHGRSVYVMGGLAEAQAYDRVEPDFDEAIRSFRPLSAAEAEAIRPNRIRFYTVRAGDTWQSIAQDAGQGIVPSNTLAIMNGFPVNEQPRADDRIKIVVEG